MVARLLSTPPERWQQPKVALVAIIRKLMTAVYSVAKHRRPFVLPPIYTPAAGGAVVALAH